LGLVDIARELLSAKDAKGQRRIHLSEQSGTSKNAVDKNLEALKKLKSRVGRDYARQLFVAVANDKIQEVEGIIDKNFKICDGLTPWTANLNAVNTSFLMGQPYEQTDTPVLAAAKRANFEIAKMLLNAKNALGSYRVKRDSVQTEQAIKLLSDHKLSNMKNKLFEAIKLGNHDSVRTIVEEKFFLCEGPAPLLADLNAFNTVLDGVVGIDENDTPLLTAVKKGNPEIIEVLLGAGDDLGKKRVNPDVEQNKEAVHRAISSGSEAIIEAFAQDKSFGPYFVQLARKKINEIEADATKVDLLAKYKNFVEKFKSELEGKLEKLQASLGVLKGKLGLLKDALEHLKTSLTAQPST
jgi:ankyrin repeat protein